MLSRKDFLALVLPPLGEGESYCTVGIKEDGEDKDVRQRFVPSIEDIDAHAEEFIAKTYNAFYGMAKYGPEGRRTTKNAVSLKSFFVDVDCGTGKPFADLAEGMTALKAFCKATNLPRPTIVKSGMGAHVYWVMDTALPREQWSLHAERLKELCVEHGFKVDPAVTGEAARVLRIPGTYHVKDPTNPILVEILHVGQVLSVEQVSDLLAPSFEILSSASAVKRELDPVTAALMGNKDAYFKTLLTKSLEGNGCAQIAHIYTEQESIEYPLWWAGLSIAQRCLDRDKAIHLMSNKHPGYNREETEKKATGTGGPQTCAQFKKLNPALCEGCRFNGKIATPLALAEVVVEADESQSRVSVFEPITEEVVEYEIPKYPFPFFRGRNGGIYVKTKNKDDDETDELLYPYDFYVVKRMVDPDVGETLLLRLHTPKDGVRDFIMPLTTAVSKEKFMALVASKGVAVLGKKQDLLMQYVTRWNDELMKDKAETAHRQFGWLDDDSGMIVGEREIRATEVLYSPPSAPTLPVMPFFQPKGDFHVWKDIVNYYSKPGMEARAFAFFLGFGTPLMRFTALDGFLVNLVSRDSGTGKTTILHAINSIYGRPKELMLAPKDTYNFRLNRMGVMKNFAVTMDEITNMDPEQVSNQVYDVTSGRAKHRLKQHENVERNNNTKFQTGMVSSSNRSLMDTLLSIKGFPDGELKRILEIHISNDPNNDATWSRTHFERLMDNYGHAIEPYAQAVIGQLPAVKELLNKTRDRVDTAANLRPSERYWSLMVSLAVTGGLISKKLGLHDIPTQPVFDFGIKLIETARAKSREYMFDGDEFLGIFMQRHFHEVLVINGKVDRRTGLEVGPIREPRNALTMRYEPDTKMLYVSVSAYRQECNKSMMNFEETLKPYLANKSLVVHSGGEYTKRKRMFVGTTASTNAATTCLWFDTSKLDFFNEEVLLKEIDATLQYPDPDPVGQV